MTELPVRQKGLCCELELPADHGWAAERARLLRALADPTRLAMVCVCDFTATFDLGQPTISHHMGRLRAAGLVESEKRGLWIYYRLRRDLTPATVGLIDAVVADAPAVSRRRTARPAPAAPA